MACLVVTDLKLIWSLKLLNHCIYTELGVFHPFEFDSMHTLFVLNTSPVQFQQVDQCSRLVWQREVWHSHSELSLSMSWDRCHRSFLTPYITPPVGLHHRTQGPPALWLPSWISIHLVKLVRFHNLHVLLSWFEQVSYLLLVKWVTNLLSHHGWTSLQSWWTIARLTMMYKILNNMAQVDFGRLHKTQEQKLRAPTKRDRRAHSKQLARVQCTRNYWRHSFLPRTILDWNDSLTKAVSGAVFFLGGGGGLFVCVVCFFLRKAWATHLMLFMCNLICATWCSPAIDFWQNYICNNFSIVPIAEIKTSEGGEKNGNM